MLWLRGPEINPRLSYLKTLVEIEAFYRKEIRFNRNNAGELGTTQHRGSTTNDSTDAVYAFRLRKLVNKVSKPILDS